MKKGFTLIELLIVMAAAAIVFSAVISNFGTAKRTLDLETSAQEISNSLKLIRQKALAASSQTELKGDLGIFILQMYAPVSNSTVRMSSKDLPGKILFDSPVSFKFAASGFPLAGYSGTAILRSSSGKTKKIIVSSFGRIRIE